MGRDVGDVKQRRVAGFFSAYCIHTKNTLFYSTRWFVFKKKCAPSVVHGGLCTSRVPSRLSNVDSVFHSIHSHV